MLCSADERHTKLAPIQFLNGAVLACLSYSNSSAFRVACDGEILLWPLLRAHSSAASMPYLAVSAGQSYGCWKAGRCDRSDRQAGTLRA